MTRNRMLAAGVIAAAAVAIPVASATAGDTRAAAPVASAAQGGLSVSPAIVSATARRGAARAVTIRNTSGRALNITVSPRAWNQSSGGAVSARRRGGLAGVGVNVSRFRLSSGSSRRVTVRMRRLPALRAQFGALEVLARPTTRRRGINIVSRIVSSLRFHPTARNRRVRLSADSARRSGRTLLLPVRNGGNVIDPVGGSVTISGRGRSRFRGIPSKVILPGRRVNVSLGSLRGLPRGSYRASVRLTQRGGTRLRVSRSFRIG